MRKARAGFCISNICRYQAQRIKKEGEDNWQDVSWGNIDPARSYRYYIKSAPGKFIDLFFYDGAISKSVAFDELLKEANLENPFEDGSLTKTMNKLEEWIDNFDKTKLN